MNRNFDQTRRKLPGDVMRIASETRAIPYDVPNVELGHHGDQCSLDAFIEKYGIKDAALKKLALIVRAADTGVSGLAGESEGLLAISRGLSTNFEDDHKMLAHGMVIYDALYATCSQAPVRAAGRILERR